ncbi:hypothetical protein D1AOALGA4SA_2317 [Olavius algarvensis Delta 1 endosymbiont]|nr:hypothetical protein D1AOALGA4SA_2317 [Olavius algarvensis Delta 1 endosymbiont]
MKRPFLKQDYEPNFKAPAAFWPIAQAGSRLLWVISFQVNPPSSS